MKIILLVLTLSIGTVAQSLSYLEDAGTLQLSKQMTVTVHSVRSECRASWIENFTLTGYSAPVTEVKWSVPLDTITATDIEPNVAYDGRWQVVLLGDFKSQEISKYGNPGVVKNAPSHSITVESEKVAERLQRDFDAAIRTCKPKP
jgi:hypothetical protein